MIPVHQDHTCGVPDPEPGSQDLILRNINDIVCSCNNAIKHTGVKKAGPSHLKPGNSYGLLQVNGKTVVVNAVVTA
jgi:hypothetical protein